MQRRSLAQRGAGERLAAIDLTLWRPSCLLVGRTNNIIRNVVTGKPAYIILNNQNSCFPTAADYCSTKGWNLYEIVSTSIATMIKYLRLSHIITLFSIRVSETVTEVLYMSTAISSRSHITGYLPYMSTAISSRSHITGYLPYMPTAISYYRFLFRV